MRLVLFSALVLSTSCSSSDPAPDCAPLTGRFDLALDSVTLVGSSCDAATNEAMETSIGRNLDFWGSFCVGDTDSCSPEEGVVTDGQFMPVLIYRVTESGIEGAVFTLRDTECVAHFVASYTRVTDACSSGSVDAGMGVFDASPGP